MRNVFDQYTQPENRLTHALAVCLSEDAALLRSFLRRVDVAASKGATRLHIVEQRLPGEEPQAEEEAERRGLPDIVIHDGGAEAEVTGGRGEGGGWCLLIESKVMSSLGDDQLRRHVRTLERRGFRDIHCLALTKDSIEKTSASRRLTWSDLYQWLGDRSSKREGRGRGNEWTERLRSYLRIAEVRLAREGYLTEGTLTMFDGFNPRFSDENPYTYGEGKRLLQLALAELRKDKSLIALGMDSKGPGRPAITGRGGRGVWDFLPLKDRPKRGAFTAYPHLTLAVLKDRMEVAVTIPNGVQRKVRRNLLDLGEEGLVEMHGKILAAARPVTKLGPWVEAYAMQRHYMSQRSKATTDAEVRFKLETSRPRGRAEGGTRVKRQPEWVGLFAQLLRQKRSNIQFGYVVSIPWDTPGLDNRKSLEIIAQSWCAMEPLLEVVRGQGD